MASLNKVQIIGYLGAEPEIRYLPDGQPAVTISVATTEAWKDKQTGEKRERTEWHRVAFYGGLAKVASDYLHVGSAVYVEGKLRTRTYTDKAGIEKHMTEILAQEMQMLGKKPATAGGKTQRDEVPLEVREDYPE